MNTRGFETPDEARTFAERLKAASELASVCTRWGLDAGRDLPTSAFSEAIKRKVFEGDGTIVRDNIHGIDIFPDDPAVRVFSFNARGSITKDPTPFIDDLAALIGVVDGVSERTKNVILLLNYALLRPDPVAQIVFSISAVEMIGQSETWSKSQRQLIERLAQDAEVAVGYSVAEKAEVAHAIRRGLHKISLRQGVFRLLDRLGLASLKERWDQLYAERTKLIHGLAPRPGVDYGTLASDVVTLCGRILLTLVGQEVPLVLRRIDQFYPSK